MKHSSEIESKVEFDIIDDILNSQEKAFEGENSKAKVSKITAANFFTKDNIGGPITKEQWLKVIRTMSRMELNSLKAFLEKLKHGEKIEFAPIVAVDEETRNYLWARFRYKNGSQTFKVNNKRFLYLTYSCKQSPRHSPSVLCRNQCLYNHRQ